MPIHSGGQIVSARREKRYTELGLLNQPHLPQSGERYELFTRPCHQARLCHRLVGTANNREHSRVHLPEVGPSAPCSQRQKANFI
jgi:hypothetical protein